MRLSENRDKSKLLGLFTLSNVLTFWPFDFLTSYMAPFDANNWQLFVQRNSYAEAPIQKTVSFDQGKARIQADTITPEGPGVMAYGNIDRKSVV